MVLPSANIIISVQAKNVVECDAEDCKLIVDVIVAAGRLHGGRV